MKKYILILSLVLISKEMVLSQNTASFYSGIYPDYFLKAGYKQKEINAKVDSAYYNLFEGTHKVYFEVGDSMA